MTKNKKDHWEKIYKSKEIDEVSWYQEKPLVALDFIESFKLKKDATIIDIGGGDSLLADHLLAEGYKNITVLDISEEALEKAKKRLGKKADGMEWIVADITRFDPKQQYDVWHDRAALHFLTNENEINNYVKTLQKSVKDNGYVILGTFSEKGPEKCSGIKVKQYSLSEMADLLKDEFEIMQCENVDHVTPTGDVQNFSFCRFRRK